MSHYNEYTFEVKEVMFQEGLPQFSSGHVKAARKFVMSCRNAEEFALRMLGKFYAESVSPSPYLPAPYPFVPATSDNWGQLNMVARAFTILPISACMFQMSYLNVDEDEETELVTDPTNMLQMGQYFDRSVDGDDSESKCVVTIQYEENPCDCIKFHVNNAEWVPHENIYPGTCISVERNPAYEMFTLPNGGLIWEGIPIDDAALKPDSYAYKVIPKADIIVHWHNVPVNRLCQIENHLMKYRGGVNDLPWGDMLSCDYVDPETPVNPYSDECSNDTRCKQYEPETILFVDWQEDRSQRTDGFGGMRIGNPFDNRNTTTLKLNFKQKRIYVPANLTDAYTENDVCVIAGWNHLFLDREKGVDLWLRVLVAATGDPIFPLINFSDIFYPAFV